MINVFTMIAIIDFGLLYGLFLAVLVSLITKQSDETFKRLNIACNTIIFITFITILIICLFM